jgi:hypothetical protein
VPVADDSAPEWPDEATESAIRAEVRDRGENLPAPAPASAGEEPEVADPKALPPLDELVNRIPPAVRESLEDLFRARFVTVKRVPARALKRS